MEITLEDGESLEDAIKRVAKEMNPEQAKPEKKAKATKTQKPTHDDPTPPVDEPIYAALHIYMRPGETEQKLRSNAGYERKMHGPGVLVFAHNHEAGAGCKEGCYERIES